MGDFCDLLLMWIASVGATLTIGSHITHMHRVLAGRDKPIDGEKIRVGYLDALVKSACGVVVQFGGHQKNRTFEPHSRCGIS